MVLVLLNLAFLPDEVVRKIDFTQEQWSVKFKKDMDEFKEKWSNSKDGKQWEFQEESVEESYRDFIQERKNSDKILQQLNLEEVQAKMNNFIGK